MYSAVLKLGILRVGRSGTGHVREQWRTQPGKYYIQGVWFHAVSPVKLFDPEYSYQFMVLPAVFNELEKFKEFGHSEE